jgi:hypothetical protein
VINTSRLTEILDLLVTRGHFHAGQRQDVLNRGPDQARHILLDKRAEMRRMLGRNRVGYQVSEIELIASFRFQCLSRPEDSVDQELITRVVAEALGMPYVPPAR